MDTLPGEKPTTLEQLKSCPFAKNFDESGYDELFEVNEEWVNGDVRYFFWLHKSSNIIRVRSRSHYFPFFKTEESSVEDLLEDAKEELRDWLIFNLDLFTGQEDMSKYHMVLL